MPSPFDFEHADPWANQFVDVESLNHAITDAIIERVAHVRDATASGTVSPTHSMLVLGPAGAGKTHLFARLRRALGPKATFVHIRPDLGVHATPRHVLAHVTSSLQRETAFLEARQLDVLVGTVLAAVQGRAGRGPLMHLDDYRRATEATRQRLVNQLLDRFEALAVDASLDYLELLLRVPLAERSERQAAYAWLSGREPSEAQLARLGRRSGLEDTEVLPALRTLAVTAALGGPLVLVFDQLENLIDPQGPPDRILAYGTLVSELVDSVRGLTLVQLALDSEWLHGIQPVLGESQKTRVQMHTELLALPTPAQRETLLRRWVAELTDGMAAFPGPFDERAVRRWCEAADMTPRALMIACRRALAGDDAATLDGEEGADALDTCLARHWDEHLRSARDEILRVAEEGTSLAPGRVVGSLMALLPLTSGVVASVSKPDYVVEVSGERGEGNVCRASIVVLQQAHPMSVAAALRKAVALAKRQAVLIVRDRGLPFRPTWRACEKYRQAVLAEPASAWFDLDHESLARALAAHDFLASATSQDLAGPLGHPIDRAAARAWLVAWMAEYDDPLHAAAVRVLQSASPKASRPPSQPPSSMTSHPPPSSTPAVSTPAATPAARTVGAIRCLEALRVASLERVVHEVRLQNPAVSREEIDAELRSAVGRVRWLGKSLVSIARAER